MFCTGCGNRMIETDKFCKMCGTKNIYYHPEKQLGFAPAAKPAEPEQREETSYVAVPVDSRTAVPEAAIIQPEVVILPVDQMGQTMTTGESQKFEAGNVIVKPMEAASVKIRKPVKEVGTKAKVGSIGLSVLAFLFIMVLLFSLYLKLSLTQSALEASIQKIDYAKMELGEFLADSSLSIDVQEGDTTVDVVYEALTKQGQVDISRGDVEEILEETSFADYLSEKLSGYARYAVTGDEPEEITPNEIVRLVKQNRDEIEDITKLQITSADLDDLERYLEEEEVLDSVSLERIDQAVEENKVDKLRTFLSDPILMVMIIVSLLLFVGTVVLISFLHRTVKAPLSYIGIPVFIGGTIFTITFIILSILKSRLFEEMKEIYRTLKPFLSSFLGRGIIIGVITAVIGILMVAGYIVIIRLQKRDVARIETAE